MNGFFLWTIFVTSKNNLLRDWDFLRWKYRSTNERDIYTVFSSLYGGITGHKKADFLLIVTDGRKKSEKSNCKKINDFVGQKCLFYIS